MTEELATQERRYLPNPVTGEAIDLRGDDEHVLSALDEIRNVDLQLRGMKRIVSDELLRRMDLNAEWTLRAGGLEARGRSPEPVSEYDGHDLAAVLEEFVKAGEISQEAAEAALEVVVSFKPKLAGIKKLLKLGGTVAERVQACEQKVEKDRYVTVKRAN